MKKVGLILAIILSFSSFTACSAVSNDELLIRIETVEKQLEKQEENIPVVEEIELNTMNYRNYLGFNIVYDDFSFRENPECTSPEGTLSASVIGKYILSCNAIITTNAKKDNVSFKNVKITYEISPRVATSTGYSFSATKCRVDISSTGYSESSAWISGKGGTVMFPSSDVYHITVIDISGSVIITE